MKNHLRTSSVQIREHINAPSLLLCLLWHVHNQSMPHVSLHSHLLSFQLTAAFTSSIAKYFMATHQKGWLECRSRLSAATDTTIVQFSVWLYWVSFCLFKQNNFSCLFSVELMFIFWDKLTQALLRLGWNELIVFGLWLLRIPFWYNSIIYLTLMRLTRMTGWPEQNTFFLQLHIIPAS